MGAAIAVMAACLAAMLSANLSVDAIDETHGEGF
jgi:hypothetical protein